jgi:hypothetical protein
VVGFNAVMTSEHFASFLVSIYPLLDFSPFRSTISLPALANVLLLEAGLPNLETHDIPSFYNICPTTLDTVHRISI